MGYYQYRFDKLDKTNSLFGKSKVRTINYVSPLLISYSTNKYHYNNILLRTGVEKELDLNKEFKFIASFDLSAYYTYSQYYHLSSNPYDGNLNFNKKISGFFGFSSTVSIGILKHFKTLQIGPAIILPIFDSWKKDPVFLEEEYSGGKHKWLNRVGVGIVCNISLHKKTKL